MEKTWGIHHEHHSFWGSAATGENFWVSFSCIFDSKPNLKISTIFTRWVHWHLPLCRPIYRGKSSVSFWASKKKWKWCCSERTMLWQSSLQKESVKPRWRAEVLQIELLQKSTGLYNFRWSWSSLVVWRKLWWTMGARIAGRSKEKSKSLDYLFL